MYIGANYSADGVSPLVIGGSILSLSLSFGGSTGYAMNPARDLGPRIVHFMLPIKHKRYFDWSYAWIPIVAPICGRICGALIFVSLVK
jgi:glycerol uptake facilitator protein